MNPQHFNCKNSFWRLSSKNCLLREKRYSTISNKSFAMIKINSKSNDRLQLRKANISINSFSTKLFKNQNQFHFQQQQNFGSFMEIVGDLSSTWIAVVDFITHSMPVVETSKLYINIHSYCNKQKKKSPHILFTHLFHQQFKSHGGWK